MAVLSGGMLYVTEGYVWLHHTDKQVQNQS